MSDETTETTTEVIERTETPEPPETLTPAPAPAPVSRSTTSDESTALVRELIGQTQMQRETVQVLMNRVDSLAKYLMQVTSEMQETMAAMRDVMSLSEKVLVENDQQTERLGTAVHALITAEQNLTTLYQAAMDDEPLPDEEPEPDEDEE